eukprot:scaffold458466_cov21-Prasinocladus_malaysianus.AAC.1
MRFGRNGVILVASCTIHSVDCSSTAAAVPGYFCPPLLYWSNGEGATTPSSGVVPMATARRRQGLQS